MENGVRWPGYTFLFLNDQIVYCRYLLICDMIGCAPQDSIMVGELSSRFVNVPPDYLCYKININHI
jgi:hypothetical protein